MKSIDKSMGLVIANLLTFLMALPLIMVTVAPYLLIWGDQSLSQGADRVFDTPWVFVVLFFGGIIVHELIHGLTWQALSGNWGSVKYGFKWHTLTPYAHLNTDISVMNYRIGAWMPGLIVGLLPLLIGLAFGLGAIFWFGFIFTWAAGGDMLILWSLRDVPDTAIVRDHPDRVGCIVYLPQSA